ncbi:MAG: hypothetical protein IPL26_13525 [Leptospiraceae bacterium]|nr:hypothetical protein [Leptospiraceae bacterium]
MVSFLNLINNAILILVYFVLVLITSLDLFLFIILILAILLVIFKQIFQYTFSLSKQQAELRRKYNSVLLDSLNGLRVVKAFSIEDYMSNETLNITHKYFSTNSKLVILNSLGKYIPLILVLIAYGVYCLSSLIKDTSSISVVLASLVVLLRLLLSIGAFTSIVSKILGELKGTILLVNLLNEKDSFQENKMFIGVCNSYPIRQCFLCLRKHYNL